MPLLELVYRDALESCLQRSIRDQVEGRGGIQLHPCRHGSVGAQRIRTQHIREKTVGCGPRSGGGQTCEITPTYRSRPAVSQVALERAGRQEIPGRVWRRCVHVHIL